MLLPSCAGSASRDLGARRCADRGSALRIPDDARRTSITPIINRVTAIAAAST
jgi:hypothetical protein